jgi:hypothetical protein
MIDDIISKEKYGLHYGNRLLLPCEVEILKVIFNDEILMDFSSSKYGAEYTIKDGFTEIYFKEVKSVEDELSKFESIKMIVVDREKNLFDFNNHQKISLHTEENHKLKITKLDDDVLFIE